MALERREEQSTCEVAGTWGESGPLRTVFQVASQKHRPDLRGHWKPMEVQVGGLLEPYYEFVRLLLHGRSRSASAVVWSCLA